MNEDTFLKFCLSYSTVHLCMNFHFKKLVGRKWVNGLYKQDMSDVRAILKGVLYLTPISPTLQIAQIDAVFLSHFLQFCNSIFNDYALKKLLRFYSLLFICKKAAEKVLAPISVSR